MNLNPNQKSFSAEYAADEKLWLQDFHYQLPPELIAKTPCELRTASRLMSISGRGEICHYANFRALLDLVNPGDLLVFNNTKVMPARLFGSKASGGKIELLIERILDENKAVAKIRSSKSPKPGTLLHFVAGQVTAEVLSQRADLYQVRFHGEEAIADLLQKHGELPLPPYLNRAVSHGDYERYQTVYAEKLGSVAAPTAGLHFDDQLLADLTAKQVEFGKVTLHIGAGTFQPIRVENIKEHVMHTEYCVIDSALCQQVAATKARGKRVIAIGTTSVRALESATDDQGILKPLQGETGIFIYPGYHFKLVDAMVTNFHLPGSTLLLLVAAFAGKKTIDLAYQTAITERYRFYSYGDAMFINRALI